MPQVLATMVRAPQAVCGEFTSAGGVCGVVGKRLPDGVDHRWSHLRVALHDSLWNLKCFQCNPHTRLFVVHVILHVSPQTNQPPETSLFLEVGASTRARRTQPTAHSVKLSEPGCAVRRRSRGPVGGTESENECVFGQFPFFFVVYEIHAAF